MKTQRNLIGPLKGCSIRGQSEYALPPTIKACSHVSTVSNWLTSRCDSSVFIVVHDQYKPYSLVWILILSWPLLYHTILWWSWTTEVSYSFQSALWSQRQINATISRTGWLKALVFIRLSVLSGVCVWGWVLLYNILIHFVLLEIYFHN